ncbi:cupredoxin domain-containing protein [Chloroflexota bacterium]
MDKIGSVFGKHLAIAIMVVTMLVLTACTSTPATTPTSTPGTGESVTIKLSAENISFNKGTIRVPAGAEVTVVFENKDSVPHNLAIYKTESASEAIFVGEIITGPNTVTYRFTAPLTPLKYFFRCDVHPAMNGDFVVYGTLS